MIHLLKVGGRAGIVLPDGSLTGDGIKQRVREKLLKVCNLHTIIRLPNSVFQPYATVATNLLFFDKVNSSHSELDSSGEESPAYATKEIWYYEHKLPEGQKSYSKTKLIRLEEFDPIKKWWNKRKESDLAWKVNIDTIIERNFDLDIKNPHKAEEEKQYSSSELIEMLSKSFEKSNELLSQIKNFANGE